MLSGARPDHLDQHVRELEERLHAAEEALRCSQGALADAAPYRTLVQCMAEGALVLTSEDRIVYSNQQFAAMLGVSVDLVMGSSIHDFIALDDAPALAALLTQARLTAAKAILRLQGPGGKTVAARLSVKAVALDGQEGACVLVNDLTETSETQRMHAAERLERSILEDAAAPILLVDLEGRIIRANRAAERLIHQSLLMRDFDAVFQVRGPMDWSYSRILAYVQSAPIAGLELAAALSRDRTVDLLLSAVPLFDDDAELLGCILTLDRYHRAQAGRGSPAAIQRAARDGAQSGRRRHLGSRCCQRRYGMVARVVPPLRSRSAYRHSVHGIALFRHAR